MLTAVEQASCQDRQTLNIDIPFSLAEQALLQFSHQLSRAQTLAHRTASSRGVAWMWPVLPCPAGCGALAPKGGAVVFLKASTL